MTTKLSLNVHAQGADHGKVEEFIRKTDPSWILIMDDQGWASRLQKSFPNTNVLMRRYEPFSWLNQPPSNFIDAYANVDRNLWIQVCNEPGFDKTLLKWTGDLIEANMRMRDPLRLVVLNLSVGVPIQFDEWNMPEAQRVLQLASKYRDHVVIGLHEYGHTLVTSGLQDQHIHTDPKEWPKAIDLRKNDFHVGRVRQMIQRCQGFPPPRVVMTEFGIDALGDMEQAGFPKDTRGWKPNRERWLRWFGNVSDAEIVYTQMWYAANVIAPYVEGWMWYCYGHIDKEWESYDLTPLHTELTELVSKGHKPRPLYGMSFEPPAPLPPAPLPPVTLPPVEIPPKDKRETPVIITGLPADVRNLRRGPSLGETVVAQVKVGDLIIIRGDKEANGWREVSFNGIDGWMKMPGVQFRDASDIRPTVVTIPVMLASSEENEVKAILQSALSKYNGRMNIPIVVTVNEAKG